MLTFHALADAWQKHIQGALHTTKKSGKFRTVVDSTKIRLESHWKIRELLNF